MLAGCQNCSWTGNFSGVLESAGESGVRGDRLVCGSSVPRFRWRSLVFPDFHRRTNQPRRQTTEQQREHGGRFETAVRLLFFRQIEHVRPRLFGDLVASGRVQRSSHDRRMEVGNLWDFRRDISRQGDLRSTAGPI